MILSMLCIHALFECVRLPYIYYQKIYHASSSEYNKNFVQFNKSSWQWLNVRPDMHIERTMPFTIQGRVSNTFSEVFKNSIYYDIRLRTEGHQLIIWGKGIPKAHSSAAKQENDRFPLNSSKTKRKQKPKAKAQKLKLISLNLIRKHFEKSRRKNNTLFWPQSSQGLLHLNYQFVPLFVIIPQLRMIHQILLFNLKLTKQGAKTSIN